MSKTFLPFRKARAFAKSLHIENAQEWLNYLKFGKKPENIPACPNLVYKNKGWVSWGDWLGTGVIASQKRQFRSYKQARKYIRTLKLKSVSDWLLFCKSGKRPDDIPFRPADFYRETGWSCWNDWLGTKNVPYTFYHKAFKKFKSARTFARTLHLKSHSDWKEYAQSGSKPNDIPASPHKVYRDLGWISWGDWLGTGNIATQQIKFKSFHEARKFARRLNLKSSSEWKSFHTQQRPKGIPSSPNRAYKDRGWVSYKDWLGIT